MKSYNTKSLKDGVSYLIHSLVYYSPSLIDNDTVKGLKNSYLILKSNLSMGEFPFTKKTISFLGGSNDF